MESLAYDSDWRSVCEERLQSVHSVLIKPISSEAARSDAKLTKEEKMIAVHTTFPQAKPWLPFVEN